MIAAAMVVVAGAAVLLVVGVARGDDLAYVYAAIGACLLAAGLLVAGVLRARPRARRRWVGPDDGSGPGSGPSRA